MELNGHVSRYSGLVPNMSVLALLEAHIKLTKGLNAMARQVRLPIKLLTHPCGAIQCYACSGLNTVPHLCML